MSKGTVGTGWKLVWRHSKILWWVFAVNLILGFLATITPRVQLGSVLDRSLESNKFVNGFDMGAFIELVSKPEVTLTALMRGSIIFTYLFFVFMLFILGGILTAYREDRRLTMGEFFEASGACFWRMVRLFLLSIIPMIVIGIIVSIFFGISSRLASEVSTFYVRIAGIVVGVILFLLLRLWFDVSQVRAVAQNEHGMFHNLRRAFRITTRALGGLLWMYLRISIVAWAVLWLGLWLWTHLPARHIGLSWLLLQFVLLTQIFARLWQRASSVAWYANYAEEHPAAVVEFTTPHPAEIGEVPGASVPAPEPTPPVPPPPEPTGYSS